jgi:iron complex outermembrane receptor protein
VISIAGTFRSTVTNGDGKFSLTIKNPDTVVLQSSLLGFQTQSDSFRIASDTTIAIQLKRSAYLQDEVIITSTRADERSGVAFTTLDKSEIESENNGRDIPYILQSTPSLVATSDAGTGIGYTGVRIRGTDATRINVTLNGIPLNDAESHQLYWVDLPDLVSSADNIQVQRGVGTSTNGAGAFGGSINIQSSKPSPKPFVSSTNGYGTFNTLRNNIIVGSGMIDEKWNFEGRISKISSDGYIDRATADLTSASLTAGYYGKKDLFKINILTGKEVTYQSWLGVPEYALDTSRTLNLYTYENQVDDYGQDHFQFFWAHDAGKSWTFHTALHYTEGKGYYEEYKEDQMLSDYQLPNVITGNDTISETDLVRRKWLDNDFYGLTWSLNYEPGQQFNLTLGGAANRYDGDHFGKVIWAQFNPGEPDHEYYRNTGIKTDYNVFLKVGGEITAKLYVYGDLQLRTIGYDFTGIDDNGNALPQSDRLTFFNPKAGLSYAISKQNQAYVSFGVANKEPTRSDYVDNPQSMRPGSETLYDLETGYRHQSEKVTAGVNVYYMKYKDQLAVTGRLNDTGDPVRVNIPDSYRAGIEADASVLVTDKLELRTNVTLSENKIDTYVETLYNYDDGSVTDVVYNNTELAYSPSITAGLSAGYNLTSSIKINASARYVGEQFLDNTSTGSRSLDAYTVTDLRVDYNIRPKFMKGITLSAWINNIFDQLYESNGYTYSYIYGGELLTENFYYPQAGRSFMAQIKLDF